MIGDPRPSGPAISLWEDPPLFDPSFEQTVPHLVPYLLPGSNQPCVIVCPGGGYRQLAEHEGAPAAIWLNTLGISAFVLTYRVFPHRFPTAFLDAQRAVRLARFHAMAWGVDPNRIGLLGFSAGAHLSAHAGTCHHREYVPPADAVDRLSARPDALILAYPVISPDLIPDRKLVSDLVPDTATNTDDIYLDKQVSSQTPPCFLWHTADDEDVPVENSLRFARLLAAHGVPFALHVFPEGGHGLGLAEGEPLAAQWTVLCGTWLGNLWSLPEPGPGVWSLQS